MVMMFFDLWMLCLEWSIYVVVVNFFNDVWVFCNVIIGFLEIFSMVEVLLEVQLQDILSCFNFLMCIIVYVKDEGGSLDIIILVLVFVVFCEVLEMDVFYVGVCFGYVFLKCCEYVIDNFKVSLELNKF